MTTPILDVFKSFFPSEPVIPGGGPCPVSEKFDAKYEVYLGLLNTDPTLTQMFLLIESLKHRRGEQYSPHLAHGLTLFQGLFDVMVREKFKIHQSQHVLIRKGWVVVVMRAAYHVFPEGKEE